MGFNSTSPEIQIVKHRAAKPNKVVSATPTRQGSLANLLTIPHHAIRPMDK